MGEGWKVVLVGCRWGVGRWVVVTLQCGILMITFIDFEYVSPVIKISSTMVSNLLVIA